MQRYVDDAKCDEDHFVKMQNRKINEFGPGTSSTSTDAAFLPNC